MLQTKTYSEGSFDRYNGTSNGYILDLVLTEEATDLLENTSLVSYKLQLRSGPSNRFDWELTGTLSLNGKTVATATAEKYLDYNETWVLLSGQVTVPHNTDGTLTMDFSATVSPWNGGNSYTPPTLTVADTMALTAIPRASAVAATSVFIEDTATIAVSRKSADYTHSIGFAFGALTGFLADATGTVSATEVKLTDTALLFPIPASFYAQIPESPSGVCTLTCTTYAGSAVIGTAQANFTVTADPARCAPLVGGTAQDTNEETLALTGDSQIFVAGVSNAQCTVQAQARQGASITAVYVNGVKTEEAVYTLPKVTTADIVFRAVDSRGYSAEYTVPALSLVAYVPLSFSLSAARTDPTSGNGQLRISGKWYAGAFGAADNSLQAKYCIDGGAWAAFTPQLTDGDITATVALSGLDYQSGHAVQVQLEDALQTLTKSVTVSKGIPVFDWGENDVRFHVPVIFTAADGTKFTLSFTQGQLKGEIYE